jgi:SAM-dependent methyltransferase
MIPDDLAQAFKHYTFYHVIDLGDGVVTPGKREYISWQAPALEEIRCTDLHGKRVLDIGCRDGLFSFEAERRGGRVLGIDHRLSAAAVEFLIPHLKSSIEMRELNVNDLQVAPQERFDYVIFAGVLYHLRMPFLALKRIADAMNPGGALLIETAMMLNFHQHPLVYVPAPQDSPYEVTSVTFFNHRAIGAALASMGFEDIECRAIIMPSAGNARYHSWQAFLKSSHAHKMDAQQLVIGRGTYVCRRSRMKPSEPEEWLNSYWFGTLPMKT